MTARATPTSKNPTHSITVTDGTLTYGLKLADNPARAIQDNTATPSTLVITGGGNKYGNGDPSFSHIEQRDWTGGRGQEDFQDDGTRYRDSSSLWTLSNGKLHLGPRWEFSNNFGIDDARYAWDFFRGFEEIDISRGIEFTASSSYSLWGVGVWIKNKNGATTSVTTYANLYDSSGTLIVSAKGNVITDTLPTYVTIRFPTPPALTSGTKYRIMILGNGLEISCVQATGLQYANTSWTTKSAPYFKLYRSTAKKSNVFFNYGGMLYVATSDGTTGQLFINGWRDKVVAGATSTAFTTANAATYHSAGHVKIISGTGAGQVRYITRTLSPPAYTCSAFDTTPDATSEVIIYPQSFLSFTNNEGEMLQEIATTGLSGNVKSVCVAGDTVYFGQGSGANIRKMKFDVSANAHTFADDGTNKADMLYTWFTTGKTKIVRALNDIEVSFADLPATPYSTALTFGTAIKVGSSAAKITNIIDYNNTLWVSKEDGLWFYNPSTKQFDRLNIGLDATPSKYTGKAMAAQNLYLYFSIDFSLERLYGGNQYGGTVDDIGLWKGTGLGDKSGRVLAVTSAYSWLFVAVANRSKVSIFIYNGIGYHEICSFETIGDGNINFSGMAYQSFEEGNPRLWLGIDNEIVFIELSENPFAPLQRERHFTRYIYHGYIVSSGIDYGVSHQPKYYNSISVSSENLSDDAYIDIDVQYDENVGTDTWTYLGRIDTSPYQKLEIGAGTKYNFAYRLRVLSEDISSLDYFTVTPVINAVVLEGFVRTPHKRVWVVRAKNSPYLVTNMGNPDVKPSVMRAWLETKMTQASKLTLNAVYSSMHEKDVILDNYRLVPKSHDDIQGEDGFELWMTFREA